DSSSASNSGGRGSRSSIALDCGCSVETMSRTMVSACSSFSARWSTTPLFLAWRSPPPKSSALISSPVTAFTTRGSPAPAPPLPQGRAAEKDRPLVADDDALVAHRRDVGAAGGAAPHHAGDLRDALRRHLRLVEEDAAEM